MYNPTSSSQPPIGAFGSSQIRNSGQFQWIYFADNALSTWDLDFIVQPYFGRQSSFRRGFLSRHCFRRPSYWSFSEQPILDSWSLLSGYTLPTTHFRPLIWSFQQSHILGNSQVFAEDFSADTVSDDLHIGAFQSSLFQIRGSCSVDILCRQHTFDL